MQNPIIAALDVPTAEQALKLAQEIAPAVGAFKIGKGTVHQRRAGHRQTRPRHRRECVFSISSFTTFPTPSPRPLRRPCGCRRADGDHSTSGGSEMMRAAEQSRAADGLQAGRNAPLVLGVTVLTSHDANTLAELGWEPNIGKQVERLHAQLAAKSGLRGLVCSPLEIVALRKILPASMQLVTPGIRTGAEKADDQKRIAHSARSDGRRRKLAGDRPTDLRCANPRAAAESILTSLR